jgi:hypothetical protein
MTPVTMRGQLVVLEAVQEVLEYHGFEVDARRAN